VVVVSSEDLGIELVEVVAQPISEADLETLRAIYQIREPNSKGVCESAEEQLREPFSKEYYLEKGSLTVTAQQIADSLNKSKRLITRQLPDLASRGLVSHVGQRGGWLLTPTGAALAGDSTGREEASDQIGSGRR
jgi:predicted HTH transcriptional regulator